MVWHTETHTKIIHKDWQQFCVNTPQKIMSSAALSSKFLRYIHPGLEIPADLQKVLLPTPALSVTQFLQFPLPSVSPSPTVYPPSAFFSQHAPTTDDVSLISKLPVPSIPTIQGLHQACKSTFLSENASFLCPHAPLASGLRVPLWTITYWTEVIDLRKTREPWVRAEAALRKRKKGSRHSSSLIDEAYLALSTLQWSGNIQGFDNEEPINHLARYATHQWLSDIHENQMLDILRRELLLDPTTSGIEVESLEFLGYIESAYKQRGSGEYEESKYFAHTRRLGKELSSGARKSVLLLKNLDNEHWVALDLNFKESYIRYGDSFGEEPPPELMCAVDWWTYHHTGQEFGHSKLAITCQEDGFSCGLLAYNCLAHRANPTKHPLIEATKVDDARLEILLAVIRRHTDNVVSLSFHC